MTVDSWRITGVVALAVIVVAIPAYVVRDAQQRESDTKITQSPPTFVGREQCVDCHTEAYESWLGSHHDDAMDYANEDTVLGDFDDAEFEHFVHLAAPLGEVEADVKEGRLAITAPLARAHSVKRRPNSFLRHPSLRHDSR